MVNLFPCPVLLLLILQISIAVTVCSTVEADAGFVKILKEKSSDVSIILLEEAYLTNEHKHRRSRRLTGRGPALNTSECDTVTSVPDTVRTEMGLDSFYRKYTHAYGIPIISSDSPPDLAIRRGCYTVRFLLADRQDLRDDMHDSYGRVGIIGLLERTTDIPEHSYLPDEWNERARGLGGTPNIPISTNAEENVLCYGQKQDLWYEEDVLVHEFSHGIHLISINQVDPSWKGRLTAAHQHAKDKGLWQNTYAISNFREYFAEGVQSFFNVEVYRPFVDNVHNNISTREDLLDYDPDLFELIREIFPCENHIVDRCHNQSAIDTELIRKDCPFMVPRPTPDVGTSATIPTSVSVVTSEKFTRSSPSANVTKPTPTTATDCVDNASFCEQIATINECAYNNVILNMCRRSCRVCAGCLDYLDLCAELAERDFCIHKENYMSRHCGKSCETCGKSI